MGILDKIRRRYRNAATVTAEDSRFSAWLAGKGYVLGPEKALQVAAVFRCVDIITKTMGTLPIHLMKRVGEGGRERAEITRYIRWCISCQTLRLRRMSLSRCTWPICFCAGALSR